MNEEMQKQLSRILELMLNGLEKAGDVASKELPGLIEDYLQLFVIKNLPIGSLILMLVMIGALFVWYKKAWTWADKYCAESDGLSYMISLFALVVCLVVLGISTSKTISAIKEIATIKLAPKAYLIEKLRK